MHHRSVLSMPTIRVLTAIALGSGQHFGNPSHVSVFMYFGLVHEATSLAHELLPCLQFGHLFAKGETREAAIRAMVVALKEVKIRGEIRTIVDYAMEMIQSPDFVGNNIHTGWLDSRIASQVG